MRHVKLYALMGSFILPVATARGAEPLRVLGDTVDGVPLDQMLHVHLLNRAREQLAARAEKVVKLSTVEELQARQRYVRETIIRSIGGFPERTPLNAKVVGRIDGDDYRVEKVIYESRPKHHVTAALYLPKPRAGIGDPPYPAVLVPCGHSAVGKAEDAYQRVCLGLVKHGFVVLCYDPISQGERHQALDDKGKPLIPASTTEHTVIGVQCMLLGTHVAGYRIWDGVRSIDYLLSRPEVDGERIGVTGNSGGGTMTAYMVVADERLKCAAPSCYITSFRRLFETIGPQDGEQNLTGAVVDGVDHADFIEVFAPKPILICAATQDFFDIRGTWDTFREAKRFYTAYGYSERVDLIEVNDKHGFTQPRRVAVLRWMRRWLQGRDEPVNEPEMTPATPKALQCSKTGRVVHDLGGKSTFDLNRDEEERLVIARAERFKNTDATSWLAEVKKLVGIDSPGTKPDVRVLGKTQHNNMRVQRFALRPEKGITLPVLLCEAGDGAATGRPVLYVNARGIEAGLTRSEEKKVSPIEALVHAGRRVVAVDLRGWGETKAKASPHGNLNEYASDEWQDAFLALHTGKTLLALRAQDVLSAAAYCAGLPGGDDGVSVIGVGAAGPVVLHAAALDARIKEVITDGGLASWSLVQRETLAQRQLPSVVVGALHHYDLTLLAERVAATRRLAMLNLADARGRRLTLDAARSEFVRALQGGESRVAAAIRVADTSQGRPYAEILAGAK